MVSSQVDELCHVVLSHELGGSFVVVCTGRGQEPSGMPSRHLSLTSSFGGRVVPHVVREIVVHSSVVDSSVVGLVGRVDSSVVGRLGRVDVS